MEIFHCVSKTRDKHKGILMYILENTKSGKHVAFEPDNLKKLIKTNSIIVDNLKLTSDNKLINCNKDYDTIIDKYVESCKILGIKPLNIKLINGKYIITDIPKDINIVIPQFVDGICMKKELCDNSDKYIPKNNESDINNIMGTLKGLSSKTDKVINNIKELDNKTSNIIENQHIGLIESSKELNDIQKELAEMTEKIDNIPKELTIITDYVNGLTIKKLEENKRFNSLVDKLSGTVLEDAHKYFLTKSRILDLDDIDKNSKMLKENSNMLINKNTYEASHKSLKGSMIAYENINNILPYLNYAANMYEEIYNKLLIDFDIDGDKNPENVKKSLELISNWIHYMISACIVSTAFTPAAGGLAVLASTVTDGNIRETIKGVFDVSLSHTEWQSGRTHAKESLKTLKRINKKFPDLQDTATMVKNYLDKEILLFALETLVLASTDAVLSFNKEGFYNRVIIKVLSRLRNKEAINYKEIELQVKASYLAACMYVNENCKFSNDFELDYIHEIISRKPKFRLKTTTPVCVDIEKLTKEEKAVYIRQQYYYAYVLEYFRLSLCQCNIKQQIVELITKMFIEEAVTLGLGPKDITKEEFLRPSIINIRKE